MEFFLRIGSAESSGKRPICPLIGANIHSKCRQFWFSFDLYYGTSSREH